MELTVLGASGSFPSADSACSGYLVRSDGFTAWMDAGNGTMMELQRHVELDDVGAIILSHAHPDHCADMYPFFYSLLPTGKQRDVYAPPDLYEKLDQLVGDDSKEQFRTLLRWNDLRPGDTTEIGPFVVEAWDSIHSSRNNTMRLTADGKTVCYSGDTGPNEHLARAAAGADLFLCEASWLNEQKGIMGPIHLTAGEAGQAARDAGCARLVLTHVWPINDLDTVRAQASEHYEGPIETAVGLGTVKL